MTRTVISPALRPRDSLDAALFIACTLVLGAFLVGFVALSFAVSRLFFGTGVAFPLVASLALMVLALGAASTMVYWLKIDASGLTFGRRAGGPKHLRWSEIRIISPASRREVVLHGWLWPPLPPREATRCASSLGHYRIEYKGGYCFFPPANEEEFLGALAYWRAHALDSPQA